MKQLSSFVLLGLVAGCPGSSTPASVVDDPLAVSDNQQGTTGSEAAAGPRYAMTSSPLPDTYVWCANTEGDACLRAIAALGGVLIKHPESAPSQLYMLEDLPDDCTAPGMLEIRRRLDAAMDTPLAGWHDQYGAQLYAASFPDVYAASGCIADSMSPIIKIAASSTSTPRTYLVRVWDTGMY